MKKKLALPAAGLLLAGFCLAAYFALTPAESAKPAAARPSLDDFEKEVLLGLDGLRLAPAAKPFLRELDKTGLRKAMDKGLDDETLRRFKSVLAEHARDPAFRVAVRRISEPSAASAAAEEPCGGERTERAAGKSPDFLSGEDPGCRPDEEAAPLVDLAPSR